MKKMTKLWEEWIEVLEDAAPQCIESINAGAPESSIEALEKLIGAKLPKDFADFYRIHDGQTLTGSFNEGLVYVEELLSLERIMHEWKLNKQVMEEYFTDTVTTPEKGIKANWWNPLWIPFTADGSGNSYCIDLDPADGGKRGQVIRMLNAEDDRELMTASFAGFIDSCISAMD